MLVIRLFRVGKRNRPSFRIVVTDKKNPTSAGRFLEILGFYDPLKKDKKINAERVKYWLSVGAKASDTVHNLLVSEKVIEAKKAIIHIKKKPVEEKPAATSEKPAAETSKSEEAAKEEPKEEVPAEPEKEEPKSEPITETNQEPSAAEPVEATEPPKEETAQ